MKKSILALALLMAGCGGASVGVGFRAYDPYYADYHTWGPDEGVYYNRWVVENHRENRDFRRLNRADQNAYWQWRHAQH